MSDATRFAMPVKKARPRGARLIEGYSPKLGRRVCLYSRQAFELWLDAESDPAIRSFCERPALMTVADHERTIDFWVRYADREAFLLIADEDILLPVDWMGIPVRRKPAAELAARRRWISNWERMLPIINLTRDSVTRQHLSDIKRYVKAPMPLMRIEREFVTSDPTSIRGAVFSLLASGSLIAPALRTEPLSLLTVFEPSP